ncbi:hypothetical protein [uncultured Campylobacter sp.]|nr:hypothetical protein [uncultured Campylobacter sp.]
MCIRDRRGTAWISSTVDKVIDKKINSFDVGSDDFSQKPPRDFNF